MLSTCYDGGNSECNLGAHALGNRFIMVWVCVQRLRAVCNWMWCAWDLMVAGGCAILGEGGSATLGDGGSANLGLDGGDALGAGGDSGEGRTGGWSGGGVGG